MPHVLRAYALSKLSQLLFEFLTKCLQFSLVAAADVWLCDVYIYANGVEISCRVQAPYFWGFELIPLLCKRWMAHTYYACLDSECHYCEVGLHGPPRCDGVRHACVCP